ncbi:MAG: Holliday junction branch migration protein RuvA [Gemmatimonadetes bacterium]|nr:Holliday junction branch migration protein RuvA [Gemmatimonadota bacterium]
MIGGVRGTLAGKHGERITVATPGGVSYELSVPLGVLERLPPEGTAVELRTVLVVREDGWLLFGFDSDYDRAVFQRLLGATGVGPRIALALVSTLGAPRVVRALKEGEFATLCTVPGIGKKTAERMVLELKDKFGDLAAPGGAPSISPVAEQAVQALVNLGFSPADADRAVRAALSVDGASGTAELIRGALQLLTRAR